MKQTYYFSHDYNARNDVKMQEVLMQLGQEGIGVYWCLVEMLYEEGGFLQLSKIKNYAFALRTSCECIATLIQSFDLFQKDDEKFWSNSIIERLNMRDKKSNKARESASIRWSNANALRIECERNAIKERKGKENKINTINENDLNDFIFYYNFKNDKKIFLTAQLRSEIRKALENETLGLWKQVIDKSANKGFNINNEFKTLGVLKMLENYTKILDDSYGLQDRIKSSTAGLNFDD